jgi:four helix bundle protein
LISELEIGYPKGKMASGFYDLNIWKKGYALLMEIYKITATFPKEEKYGLSRQMRDSSNSVIANIAEAHGRYYFSDKARVLYTSRGECEETRSHLRAALGLKYINRDIFNLITWTKNTKDCQRE